MPDIQSAIDHIKTAVDVDPWAADMAVKALIQYRDIVTCSECRNGRIHEKGRVMCNGMWHKENFFCADAKRIETEEETNGSE